MRPDPEFDPICAIFYHLQTDTPNSSGNNKVTGVLCVDSESAKRTADFTNPEFDSGTKTGASSAGDSENVTPKTDGHHSVPSFAAPCGNSSASLAKKASTSAASRVQAVSPSVSPDKATVCRRRPLLLRSGVTIKDVDYVEEEKDLFGALIQVVRKWDPDILLGYEVQMLSWGYLIQRALIFEIDLCSQLSRVKGSANQCNFDASKDRWGAAHTCEIKIAGRIMLNVWRLMRHEVSWTFPRCEDSVIVKRQFN